MLNLTDVFQVALVLIVIAVFIAVVLPYLSGRGRR